MKRRFNVTDTCIPQMHYMVKLDDRLKSIKEEYIDYGSYFAINRGRQYGKTTTLRALEEYLKEEYTVLSLDFQEIATKKFEDEAAFSTAFAERLRRQIQFSSFKDKELLLDILSGFKGDTPNTGLDELFDCLNTMCLNSPRPILLMIDEVDSSSNNQVFLDFLAQLRACYLKRDKIPTFHSVILAGVYNVKNLKSKLRAESQHQYNSPWNVGADFDMDMNFSPHQIASMLTEYEEDNHTGMDIEKNARIIYDYTSGYPVLVSSICKYIDEKIPDKDKWTLAGMEEAVKKILTDHTPLFESMICHLNDYPELEKMFQYILFQGREFAYNPDTKEINLAAMFGYVTERDGKVQIANRIFETRLYNYFYSKEELSNTIVDMAKQNKSSFIQNNRLDMDIVMKKFVQHFHEDYGSNTEKFLEENGRKFFLLYLKPIINGVGNYYIEAQTRDARRTDVIVDYLGDQFIIELKIWHGSEYNERGEKQLSDYLDYYHKDKGYLLSFNFNKKKEIGVKELKIGEKTIIEAVV